MAPPSVPMVPPLLTAAPIAAPLAAPTVSDLLAQPPRLMTDASTVIAIPDFNIAISSKKVK
jgi:hypothetical protein